MANTISPVRYTGDDGRVYTYGMDSEIFAQQGVALTPKVGGSAAVSGDTNPPLPSSVRPRQVFMKNAAGKGRYVVCLEPTADLYTGVETTLNIEDSDGVATAFTRRHTVAERFGRSRI